MLPVVDPHVRLDASEPDGRDERPDALAPLRALLDGGDRCHVLRAVHVQEDTGRDDAAEDAARVQGLARTRGSGGLPNGIVACCDIAGESGEARLEALVRHPNLRAVRVPARADLPPDTSALERHDLALEVRAGGHPAEAIVRLARARPAVRIVLDAANPLAARDAAGLAHWREELRRVSGVDNVFVKLRHAGFFPDAHAAPGARDDERLAALLARALDAVGAERLVLASGCSGTGDGAALDAAWQAFSRAAAGLAARRRDGLFRSNAVRAYRL